MNIEAIGSIGEILGALAVLVSLIYLAKQIKHSTDVSKVCLLYTSPSPRDVEECRMPSYA